MTRTATRTPGEPVAATAPAAAAAASVPLQDTPSPSAMEAGTIDASEVESPITLANRVAEAQARAEAERQPKATMTLVGTHEQQNAALRAKIAEQSEQMSNLMAATQALVASMNSKATVAPVAVKLPTIEEAKADVAERVARGEPVHGVMTDEGHYIHPLAGYQAPAGTQMDPKVMAAMVNAIAMAQAAASAGESAKPKKTEDMMAEGRPETSED